MSNFSEYGQSNMTLEDFDAYGIPRNFFGLQDSDVSQL
jgi:hypothetical protein